MSKTETWHLIAGCPHEKVFRNIGNKYPLSVDISCRHKQSDVATIELSGSVSPARCSSQPLCKALQMEILLNLNNNNTSILYERKSHGLN